MTEPTEQELHELAEKAAPRPWEHLPSDYLASFGGVESNYRLVRPATRDDITALVTTPANAAFIVALINAHHYGCVVWRERPFAPCGDCPGCADEVCTLGEDLQKAEQRIVDLEAATLTPVSDEMVREALQQLRYLVNEYATHEGVEALATLESAVTRNHHGS